MADPNLPPDIQQKLAELDLELSEGWLSVYCYLMRFSHHTHHSLKFTFMVSFLFNIDLLVSI